MSTTTDRPQTEAVPAARPRRRWGRPMLYTSYAQEMALLNTRAKQLGVLAVIAVAAYLPLTLEDDILNLLGTGLVLAVGAIGLNLLIGYAGQVSLGHAFFVGIGAYTAAVLAGDPDGRYLGFGSPRRSCGSRSRGWWQPSSAWSSPRWPPGCGGSTSRS